MPRKSTGAAVAAPSPSAPPAVSAPPPTDPKRANGEGSVYFRASDQKWVASVSLPGGRRKVRTAATRLKAESLRAEMLTDRARGKTLRTDERLTVGTWIESWLEETIRPHKRPKTYASYARYARGHIIPALGARRLADLTRQDVQRFVNSLLRTRSGRPVSRRMRETGDVPMMEPRTVRHIHAVLRNTLNVAEGDRLVDFNAAERVQLPAVPERESTALEEVETGRLLAQVEGDRLEGLYVLAVAVGLRLGEALGLRWQDVELDTTPPDPRAYAGWLTVTGAVQRVPIPEADRAPDGPATELRRVPTKTAGSRRHAALPALVVALLDAHRNRQDALRADARAAGHPWPTAGPGAGLVFTTDRGTPLDESNIWTYFRRHLAAAGIAPKRFHDLRHTASTVLHGLGVDQQTRMAILGHSKPAMTHHYTRVSPALLRASAEATDGALRATRAAADLRPGASAGVAPPPAQRADPRPHPTEPPPGSAADPSGRAGTSVRRPRRPRRPSRPRPL
jgi:integrase